MEMEESELDMKDRLEFSNSTLTQRQKKRERWRPATNTTKILNMDKKNCLKKTQRLATQRRSSSPQTVRLGRRRRRRQNCRHVTAKTFEVNAVDVC